MRESTDIQSVLASLYESLKDAGVKFDHCSVQIVDEGKECFEAYPGMIEIPLRDSAVYEAWRDKRPIYRRDLDEEDTYNDRANIRKAFDKHIRSVLDVPFSYGTIAINSLEPDAFSERDMETLEIFASVLSEGYVRYMDITERKWAEEELRKSEERYRTLTESQGEGVAIADVEERFVFANPAAHDIFGVPLGSLVGRDLREFVDAEALALIRTQTEARRMGKKTTYELESERLDGERRHLLITGTPRFDNEGQFMGTFGIFRDITERKQAEEKLARKNEELERFNKLAVGRELKMIELKKKVNALLEELGKEARYKIVG